MNTQLRFSNNEYRNWVKCSLALIRMKEELHDYVDTEVKDLHLHIKQIVASTPGRPSVGKICVFCTWKDVKKARGNHSTWYVKCRSKVCDRWLSEILALHNEPYNSGISWKNADIRQWPTNPYEIAKVFMPKGQDRTHNLPQELDAPAVLSLMKFCTWFSKKIPNVQLLSDLIDLRNEVLHCGELKVPDSNKDIGIDKMIQLLSDLNINGSACTELNRIKCEDIDVNFRENEIRALQNLVSDLVSKLAEVNGEIASLQNVQTQQSEETTEDIDEMKESLQELKKIYDKMESFLNKNPDIVDKEITRNMRDFKKDIHNLQEELSQVKVKVLSLENRLDKHKEETQMQFKGVESKLAAIAETSGNNKQLSRQKDFSDGGLASLACSGVKASSSYIPRIQSVEPVVTIASLRPYQRRWRICARVTNNRGISHFKQTKRKWNQRLNVCFTDGSKSIDAVAFGDAVYKFVDLLEEQKVYYVSGGTIEKAKSQFSGGDDYVMILDNDTSIELCEEEDKMDLPTQISFNFVMIDKLKPGRSSDVIGVVKNYRDKRVKRWSGVEVQIVDQSKKMVPLTLSKNDAENHNLNGNPVVAVKGAWFKNSNGYKFLKMMPNSKLKINPADNDKAHELHGWFEKEGHQIEFERI